MQDDCARSKDIAVQAPVELGYRPRHLHFLFHLLLLGARMQHYLWHDDLLLGHWHGHLHFLFHLLLLGARLQHCLWHNDLFLAASPLAAPLAAPLPAPASPLAAAEALHRHLHFQLQYLMVLEMCLLKCLLLQALSASATCAGCCSKAGLLLQALQRPCVLERLPAVAGLGIAARPFLQSGLQMIRTGTQGHWCSS